MWHAPHRSRESGSLRLSDIKVDRKSKETLVSRSANQFPPALVSKSMIHDFTSASGRTGRREGKCRNGGFDVAVLSASKQLGKVTNDSGTLKSRRDSLALRNVARGQVAIQSSNALSDLHRAPPALQPVEAQRAEDRPLCRVLCSLLNLTYPDHPKGISVVPLRGEPLSDRRTPWAPRREASPFRVKSPGPSNRDVTFTSVS